MKKFWINSSTEVVIFTVIVIGLYMYVTPVGGKCKVAEVEICSTDPSKGCFCKTCISCPAGYGPSQQCGGRYVNGTIIKCKPCISNKTYSPEYSIASCWPCHQCGGRETLQKCTPKRETSCSTKCRVGYVMNHAVEECIPDPSFMTTSQQTDTTKLTYTFLLPKTTIDTTTMTHVSKKKTDGTMKPFHPAVNTSGRDSDHSRDNKIILTVICTIIITAIVVFVVYYFLCKKLLSSNYNTKDKEETISLTQQTGESPRTSQEIVPWPKSLRLKDIPVLLRSDVANQISNESTVVKYWPAIAEDLGLNQKDVKAIDVAGQKRGTNQGLELFTVLGSQQPELTLTEFVTTLENLERKEVSKTIKDHYYQQKVNSVSIQTEGPQSDQQPDFV